MKNLRNIVIGIDYSKPSENALREAARIAAWDSASLTAVNVFDADILERLSKEAPQIREEVVAEASGKLDAYVCEALGPKHPHRCESVIGHPFADLIAAVREVSADLLVLGSHGNTSDETTRLGTLAGKCLRKAPANVLLVRDRQSKPFRRVVACIDFSENSEKAARQAIHIAQQDGAELEFLHIHHPVSSHLISSPGFFTATLAALPDGFEEALADVEKKNLSDFAQRVTEEAGGYPFAATVAQCNDVRAGIVDRVNDANADLVVLGTHGRSKLLSLLLGSTAEKIIRHASCSVLAVKPDGFVYTAD